MPLKKGIEKRDQGIRVPKDRSLSPQQTDRQTDSGFGAGAGVVSPLADTRYSIQIEIHAPLLVEMPNKEKEKGTDRATSVAGVTQ